MTLLLDDLKRVADGPNGLDPDVLMAMQRDLLAQVMQWYREDYVKLDAGLKARGLDEADCRRERASWITSMLQSEYRQRAMNGQGFSLPMYMEAASNHYKMTIERLGQSIRDYVSAAGDAADLHYTITSRDARTAEMSVDAMAHQVAGKLDKLDRALDGLSRVARSEGRSRDLRQQLADVFAAAREHPFSAGMVDQAQTLAAVARYERKHGLDGADATDVVMHQP